MTFAKTLFHFVLQLSCSHKSIGIVGINCHQQLLCSTDLAQVLLAPCCGLLAACLIFKGNCQGLGFCRLDLQLGNVVWWCLLN